ncbi:MAG: hypothetical protein ABUK03_05840 [Dehalococcoidales bacterium]
MMRLTEGDRVVAIACFE